MGTYLLIEPDGTASNLIVWDGVSYIDLPKGTKAIRYSGTWGPGWKWDGARCIDPNPPPPQEAPPPAPPADRPSPGMRTI